MVQSPDLSRRDVLQATGAVATTSAVAALFPSGVYAGENTVIQLALIGCGGRGTGAAGDALAVPNTKLVAMADVFPERLAGSYRSINQGPNVAKVDVPESRRFIGFDAYQKAIDALRPGDIAIMATPPGFRWLMFDYAVRKGVNVFMEKPLTVDGPSTKKFLRVAEASERAGIKVGVGLMCRHCDARKELLKRIQDGALGDLTFLRAYRMTGPVGTCFAEPKPAGISELMFQIQRFHSFLWASGGCYSDFLIHNIDECCWMKGAWPVSAKGSGGRHFRGNYIDQNFDSYSVEYTFADGAKLFLEGRNVPGCHQEFASYAHGTKGSAVISQSGHTPARCRIFRGQNFINDDVVWRYGTGTGAEPNPYRLEWVHLIDAIRNDRYYNEARRGAEASLITSMGRMAAHTGQQVTRQQMLDCEHEFAPDIDKLTLTSDAPIRLGADGKYAFPNPGVNRAREY